MKRLAKQTVNTKFRSTAIKQKGMEQKARTMPAPPKPCVLALSLGEQADGQDQLWVRQKKGGVGTGVVD